MRSSTLTLLAFIAVIFAACSDTTAPTTSEKLGRITMNEFMANTAYKTWFEAGYDAYPDAASKAQFDAAADQIRASYDSSQHSVLMVIKPSCGCLSTQREMPRLVKVLRQAGIPDSKIDIYVTDARLVGFDSVKTQYQITAAPTFIVLRNGVAKGRVVDKADSAKTSEQMIASYFSMQ